MRAVVIYLILFFGFIYSCFSQYYSETGNPIIQNYSPKDYNAASQNWSVVQDKLGIMYFGNNYGVLIYDGNSWETVPVSNNTVVRSLAIDTSDRVFVGAKGDFGYLQSDISGKLNFVSLLGLIEINDRDFLDVWNIFIIENEVYFQAESKIFKFKNNHIQAINIKNLTSKSFCVDNKIYLQIADKGLALLKNDSAVIISGGKFFINKRVQSIVSYSDNKLLVGTSNELYVCAVKIVNNIPIFNLKPKKLKTEAEKILQVNQLYHILRLNKNKYCLGTKGKGAIIIDDSGNIIQNINTKNGLIADEVYHSYLDKHNNLWLELGFGISNVKIESPITHLDETSGIRGTVLSVIRFQGTLYIGTTTGVFYLTNEGFIKISGIYNQAWNLNIIKDQNKPHKESLFVSSADGVFLIKNKQAIKIVDKQAFALLKSSIYLNNIYIANNSKLISGSLNNEINIKVNKEINVNAEIRNIVEDEKGNVWLGTNSSGIIFIKSDFFNSEVHDNYKKFITHYDTSYGLPSLNWNILYLHKTRILVATKKGIYVFNNEKNTFEPHIANNVFKSKDRWIYTMQINHENIWFDSDKGRGILLKQDDGSYLLDESAFQTVNTMFGDYGNKNSIFIDSTVTWFGLHKGILRFDKKIPPQNNQEFFVLLKNIFVHSDSVIFSCYFNNENALSYTNSVPLSFKNNNLTFKYSAPYFCFEENTTFSFFLEGFDKQWSEWSLKSEKEYTNLPKGEYIFNVKAKNIFNIESETFQYNFEISAPWYNNTLAYLIYSLLAFLLILIIVKLNIRRLKAEKISLEKIIKERTREISKQKDDIEIKNIELEQQKEEILSQNEEIIVQKEELEDHRNNLEKLVLERTRDLEIAKEKAEESDRLKSSFLANMSHEIRTPMNAIIGFSELINDPELSTEQKDELSSLIYNNCDSLLRLIDDIIDLSKIESKQLELKNTNCFVSEALNDLFKVFNERKLQLNKGHIELTINIPEGYKNITIHTDCLRLKQVLSNLTNNALKFTEAGSIEFGYSLINSNDNPKLKFYVKDTGIGMSDQQQKEIFNRFSKIETSKKKLYRGAGLGLAISKNLVEMLGGQLLVDSKKDTGSTFYFSLPFTKLAESEKL